MVKGCQSGKLPKIGWALGWRLQQYPLQQQRAGVNFDPGRRQWLQQIGGEKTAIQPIGRQLYQLQRIALQQLAQGVQLASDQVQYAARIIGRVRDYTQSHQPRRERVDVMALLHNSLTLLDWDLARHHVQCSVSADLPGGGTLPPVAGDGVMLQQVLVNLLRNAIDAMVETPVAERRLDVVCRVDAVDGRVEVAITDAGCGVGQDAAAQLFMPFFSTKPTGMGVGLNICRSLIELHQGSLWFTPNADRGCTFYVALPLASTDEAEQLPDFLDSKDFVV